MLSNSYIMKHFRMWHRDCFFLARLTSDIHIRILVCCASGVSRHRRGPQIGDWSCFPVFSALGQFLQCVLGLLEQAISNVEPSLPYTEGFQQPVGAPNVASISE